MFNKTLWSILFQSLVLFSVLLSCMDSHSQTEESIGNGLFYVKWADGMDENRSYAPGVLIFKFKENSNKFVVAGDVVWIKRYSNKLYGEKRSYPMDLKSHYNEEWEKEGFFMLDPTQIEKRLNQRATFSDLIHWADTLSEIKKML